MIAKNALYSFIESLIENAGPDSPLRDAQSFRNLKSSVNDARKVVRVECFTGNFVATSEDARKEVNVFYTVQCWVLPDIDRYSDEQAAKDAAVDESFDMAYTVFTKMALSSSLNGQVCDSYGDEFESGEANLGGTVRGVTYLDGLINQAN